MRAEGWGSEAADGEEGAGEVGVAVAVGEGGCTLDGWGDGVAATEAAIVPSAEIVFAIALVLVIVEAGSRDTFQEKTIVYSCFGSSVRWLSC